MSETKTMGTKAIREALLSHGLTHDVSMALAEVAAIEAAAHTLNRLHVGDYVYDVRDSEAVREGTPNGASTWDHPDVKAWAEAAEAVAAIAKNSPKL